MKNLALYLSLFLTVFIPSAEAQVQEDGLSKVIDFTVLQNGTMSIMYDGKYEASAQSITGILQAYDYKGRLLYDRQYALKIPDSILQESTKPPKITEAYVISASKNHSLFYGRINEDNRLTFVIILDKRGRFKKELLLSADYSKIEAEIDSKSYRAKAFFWLFANQNQLKITPYMSANKQLYAQVYLRKMEQDQKEIMFDAISLVKENDHTLIQYKDDLSIKWGHKIKGSFSSEAHLFKLTETPLSFYFILYENHANKVRPVIYVIEKNTGKISIQTNPATIKA